VSDNGGTIDRHAQKARGGRIVPKPARAPASRESHAPAVTEAQAEVIRKRVCLTLAEGLAEAQAEVSHAATRHAVPLERERAQRVRAMLAEAGDPPATTAAARYMRQVRADLRSGAALPHLRTTTAAGFQLPRTAWRWALLHAARVLAARASAARGPARDADYSAALDLLTARAAIKASAQRTARVRASAGRSARYKNPPPPAVAVLLRAGRKSKSAARLAPALLALAVSGCRPAELDGQIVEADAGGGLRLTVKGAKVNARRGQPTRVLTFTTPPAGVTGGDLAALAGEVAAAGGQLTLHYSAADDRALRRLLAAHQPGLSPYAYRHAMAGSLKASGLSAASAAAVLGHASTRSLARYGRRRAKRGGWRPTVPARVAVERKPVAKARRWPGKPKPRLPVATAAAKPRPPAPAPRRVWRMPVPRPPGAR
jgi:hypothetical protein